MSNGIFDIFDDNKLSNRTDLELYLQTVRDIIVEKKDPYYTLSKTKIKELISEPDRTCDMDYRNKLVPRLTMIKDGFSSEYLKNLVDIFIETVLTDKAYISKDGLSFLNKTWKERP